MNRTKSVFMFLTITLLLCCSAVTASAFRLPDTGQTKCYQSVIPYAEILCAGTGQDGGYNINLVSFTGNGSEVIDSNTSLIWQKEDDNTLRDWNQAVSYCASIGTGWRLPSKKELITIVDNSISRPGPTINPIFTNTNQYFYWSSTTVDSYPYYAWGVYFSNGVVNNYDKELHYYVRCVRGGK